MTAKQQARRAHKAHQNQITVSKRRLKFLLAQLSETLPVVDQSAFQLVLLTQFQQAAQGTSQRVPLKIALRNFFFFKSLQGVALYGRR